MMPDRRRSYTRVPTLLLVILMSVWLVRPVSAEPTADSSHCVAPGTWLRMEDKHVLSNSEILKYASRQRAVLLGEHHDNPDHHRWQLQVVAGLYALHPDMVLGFEMFPREVQPVLDRWVAGELSEEEFLAQSNWRGNWNFDPALYLPVFHFARLNHVPMLALNVSRELFQEVQRKGWEAIPPERRQGITDPATPSRDYLEMLAGSFVQHRPAQSGHEQKGLDQFSPEEKQAFKRFVEGQQLWDRAMAQAVADVARKAKAPLVVGMMGSGHMMDGFGVPHQLTALGVKEHTVLVPWDEQLSCEDLTPEFAYAVFGLKEVEAKEEDKPRLGIYLEPADKGVKVVKVVDNSVAAASGILVDDRILELAGTPVSNMNDVVGIVQSMVPGTLLPITVLRGDQRVEILARFPPKARSSAK